MPDSKIKVEDIPFMMLENGKISSNIDFWIGGIASDGYGEVAKCPSISISDLTHNLLQSITASPDPKDANALKDLVSELKTSLEITEKTISKLNKT